MNCIIIDDDLLSRELLRKYISEIPELDLVGVCGSPMEGLDLTRNQKVDLIFLDVEMPEKSGIEFLQELKVKPLTIFVTSKPQYAFEAFEQDAVHYIVKPIDKLKLKKGVQKAIGMYAAEKPNVNESTHLFSKEDGGVVKIKIEDVLIIEASADYMIVHTLEKKHIVHITMKSLLDKLPRKDFSRIHRSYAVKLNKIQKIGRKSVFVNNKELPMSNTYKKTLIGLISEE
ncbi:LytTR family DNA-binding domain-containing protein [Rhodonellum sp.]|uniref:LytR/AlgR family response regulator transcription factor n=1 Tax=Rhodonellum sp. TaxID=2231180 RepID=UPI0027207375|nr:LytTR family DNA-binding domain-containing protein [Rhodonellum sp.]MDO9551727.1 LytTR family DNA-binding domain-containing protein [Rhodonellum sp.]